MLSGGSAACVSVPRAAVRADVSGVVQLLLAGDEIVSFAEQGSLVRPPLKRVMLRVGM